MSKASFKTGEKGNLAAGPDISLGVEDHTGHNPQQAPEAIQPESQNRRKIGEWRPRKYSRRVLIAAAACAVILTLLTAAGIRLVTKVPAVVDQIIILTFPSGAEITFDNKPLGQTPVKIEALTAGTHLIQISKDGYEVVTDELEIVEPRTLDYKLKLIQPPGTAALTYEERVHQYQEKTEMLLASGHYAIPYYGSALYYVDMILDLDDSNQYANQSRDRIQKLLHQEVQAALNRSDLGRAQEVYSVLLEQFRRDEAARIGLLRLEGQLAARRGEVRGLLRKAEEAERAGRMVEPEGHSAYYYSRQVLAIDRQNAGALAVHNRVKQYLMKDLDLVNDPKDLDAAVNRTQRAAVLFPDDKSLAKRLQELNSLQVERARKANDANTRRVEGLAKFRRGEYSEALSDLEYAAENGYNIPEVNFSLGSSYFHLNDLERAAHYLRRVPHTAGEMYISAQAALGDISAEKGDLKSALARYKDARASGGSSLYDVGKLDDKIVKTEQRIKEKYAEPTSLTIRVTHGHGALRGSCKGTLTVGQTEVRYSSDEHTYTDNVTSASVLVTKDSFIVAFGGKPQEFKASPADKERFKATLTQYQAGRKE